MVVLEMSVSFLDEASLPFWPSVEPDELKSFGTVFCSGIRDFT